MDRSGRGRYICIMTVRVILYVYTDGRGQGRIKDRGVGGKNVFIRMVECHASLEIAPYISSAMRRRETLFSTSQKPRTDDDDDDDGNGPEGGGG